MLQNRHSDTASIAYTTKVINTANARSGMTDAVNMAYKQIIYYSYITNILSNI